MGQDEELARAVQQRVSDESEGTGLGRFAQNWELCVASGLEEHFPILTSMSPSPRTPADLLQARFVSKHVQAMLRHYQTAIEHLQTTAWEDATAKAGKFVEAALKALWVDVGETVPPGKQFKAGTIMDRLEHKAGFEDSVRLTIPRTCRVVYEIASNRGARHDPDEIDPNEMDATVAISDCSWVLAEMLRISQKGLHPARVQEIVAGLVRKRYPLIEEVDGRIYVSIKGLSARDIATLVLWHRYPGRLERRELFDTLRRHGKKAENANKAISRLTGVVDIDDKGRYRLLAAGLREVEALIKGRSAA